MLSTPVPAASEMPDLLWRELRRLYLSLQTLFPGEWGEFQEFSRLISRSVSRGYRSRALEGKARAYRRALDQAQRAQRLLDAPLIRSSLSAAQRRKLADDLAKLAKSLTGLLEVLAACR